MSKHKRIKRLKERARKLWNLAIFKRGGYVCARCLSLNKITPAVDAHHIVHKTQGLVLRYEVDNGVALCRSCHLKDDTGDLQPWCIAYISQEKFNELLLLRHGNIKQELVEMGLTMEEFLTMTIKKLEEMG